MKIDFLMMLIQQLLFCMYNVHGPCGLQFLYEILRSKLNLFIQISLNTTPPPPEKSQAQHICIP